MTVSQLQSAIAEGLGEHHNLTGRIHVRFANAAHDFALVLSPGRVTFERANGGGEATVTIKALDALLAKMPSTDVRAPELEQWLSISGDGELAANAVLLSLQRPADGVEQLLQSVENISRLMNVKAIERIARPPLEEVLRRIHGGVPFIVTGALAWRSLEHSIDVFLERHGGAPLPTAFGDAPETVRAFVGRVRRGGEGGRSYTLGVALPEALLPEFPPAYGAPSQLSPPQLWLGAGRDVRVPVTPLHRDMMCGMLGHVYGRKRFVIFPPHQSRAVYARKSFHFFQTCWAAPHAPDFERYPKLREATPIEFVLEPGELLVQPAGWFHSVFSLDELTMSISYFA
jgi:hypothetical protein